jgi:hypothetical protein
MTRLFQCDWCKDVYSERAAIALLDVGGERKIHACYDCLPDEVRSQVEIQQMAPEDDWS